MRHTLSLFLHLIFVVSKSRINEHQMRIMIEQIKKRNEASGNEMICRCKAPIPIYSTKKTIYKVLSTACRMAQMTNIWNEFVMRLELNAEYESIQSVCVCVCGCVHLFVYYFWVSVWMLKHDEHMYSHQNRSKLHQSLQPTWIHRTYTTLQSKFFC